MSDGLSRRTFIGGAAGVAASTALYDPVVAAAARRRPPAARNVKFRQGVASGGPTTNGITLWTRAGGLERRSRIELEIARDDDFRRLVHREQIVVGPATNYTVRKRVRTRALRPGEQYFYRFQGCDGSNAAEGRFRTARPADSREPIKIGFFSCQDYEEGFYNAHVGLAAEDDLDAVVCLGDYIYEKTVSDPADAVRRDPTGGPDREVRTLAEYRSKYALYHSDARLRRVRALYPMLAVWDDHEVENDYAGPHEEPGDPEDFAARRANAYRAFFEHMPYRPPRGTSRIYGRVPLGGSAEIFLLDERQYRGDQPCGGEPGPCPPGERDDPSRTMLGAEQKEWFKAALAASRADWKVCANQVMIMALDVPARSPINPDQWDGYGAERAELMDFIRANGVDDVTFVTGDIHTYYAGVVTRSGRRGVDAVDGPPVATEFVAGSITSNGIATTREQALALEQTVQTNNPHMVYNDQLYKGYAVVEASPDELRVRFRSPRTVATPRSEMFTLQEFRVARGEVEVERRGGDPTGDPDAVPVPAPRRPRV